MSRLYIPELYRIQHAILARAWDSSKNEKGETNWPTIDELVNLTKKPKKKIFRALNILQEKEFAQYNTENGLVYCRPKGKLALFKEDILEEGWEKFKANLLRWVQILGITFGSAIAIATFILNYTTTNSNKVEIIKLQKEVYLLKQKQVRDQWIQTHSKVRKVYQDSTKRK